MQKRIRDIAEQCSQPNVRVNALDLIDLRPYIESFLDPDWLNLKLTEYEKWAKSYSDPLLQRNILHRPLGTNMLIAMIWAARSWEQEYKKDTSFLPPGGVKRLIPIACSMAVLELHASKYLDSDARKHIQQRFQATDNFLSMVHEINTFAHFIRKDIDIEPKFLKKSSREEIVLHFRGQTIPVQCKNRKPGSGRLISQDSLTNLAGSIARDAKNAKKKLLVRLGSTESIRQKDVDFLRHQVISGVGSGIGPALILHKGRAFTLRTQPILGHFTVDSAREYLSSFNFHIGMLVGDPSPNGLGYNVDAIIGIDANPDDKIRSWNSLQQSIWRGAKQLKGGPPGIVAVNYTDPVSDFEVLRPGSKPMLQEIAKLIHPLPHVAAVMLSSEPDLQLPGSGQAGSARAYYKKPCEFAELLGDSV
ncbi:MAG: hypothetical protein WC333_09685 [Dehalococcoidia bacterium]|jgi:hypothetical protein